MSGLRINFLIFDSPKGDWNSYVAGAAIGAILLSDFWFPERGLKHESTSVRIVWHVYFLIFDSPKGDWNSASAWVVFDPVFLSDFWFPERGLKPKRFNKEFFKLSTFWFLIPRKGTETMPYPWYRLIVILSDFWFPERGLKLPVNLRKFVARIWLSDFWFPERGLKLGFLALWMIFWETFWFLIPRKGTETFLSSCRYVVSSTCFLIFDSPKGDWNNKPKLADGVGNDFLIFDSPKGDWNSQEKIKAQIDDAFWFLIPRKGTETERMGKVHEALVSLSDFWFPERGLKLCYGLLKDNATDTFWFLIPRKGTETLSSR